MLCQHSQLMSWPLTWVRLTRLQRISHRHCETRSKEELCVEKGCLQYNLHFRWQSNNMSTDSFPDRNLPGHTCDPKAFAKHASKENWPGSMYFFWHDDTKRYILPQPRYNLEQNNWPTTVQNTFLTHSYCATQGYCCLRHQQIHHRAQTYFTSTDGFRLMNEICHQG